MFPKLQMTVHLWGLCWDSSKEELTVNQGIVTDAVFSNKHFSKHMP